MPEEEPIGWLPGDDLEPEEWEDLPIMMTMAAACIDIDNRIPGEYDCMSAIIGDLNYIWEMSNYGAGDEWCFSVLITGNLIQYYSAPKTNGIKDKCTVTVNANGVPATAVFHIHPNGYYPEPSQDDMAFADFYGVLFVSVSSSGSWLYMPNSGYSVQRTSGTQWLNACY